MFRRECSLCGGKLRGTICTECGLDNSKNDSNYRTSSSHSGFERMTHVHDRFDPFAGKTLTKEQKKDMRNAMASRTQQMSKPSGSYKYAEVTDMRRSQPHKKKGNLGKVIGILWIIFILVGALVTVIDYVSVGDASWAEPVPDYEYEEVEVYDPYEDAQYDLPETGEMVKEVLSAGEYIGGVHISEGTYSVMVVEGTGNYNLVSEEHGIYIYEGVAEEQYDEIITDDLRIYEGAKLTVSESVVVQLYSENASSAMETMENPNTKSFTVQDEFVVGEDVIPGVYDVYGVAGAGILDFTVEFEDGYSAYGCAIVGEEGNAFSYPTVYKNLVLPEGAVAQLDDMTVELVPSEIIKDEEYLEYYR